MITRCRAYWPAAFLLLAATLSAAHLLGRPELGREHDDWAHLQFLDMVRQLHALPPANACAECYQPPFWYWTSSRLATLLDLREPALGRFLNFLGAFYHLIFIVFAIAAVRLQKLSWKAELACLLTITCWPTGGIGGIQIGNDPLLYALWGGTFFYFLRWLSPKRRPQDAALAALLSIVSWSTKENAAIPWLACSVILLTLPGKRESAIGKLGSALGLAVWAANRYRQGSFWPVANADFVISANPRLRISNSFSHVFGLNIPEYFTPYVSPVQDAGGRQYVINYLLKTGVSGELSSVAYGHAVLNQFLNLMILTGAAAVVWATIRSIRSKDYGIRFSSAVVCFSVAAIWANRIAVPLATSADFRYVYPAIVPALLILAAWCASQSKRRPAAVDVLLVCAALFSGASLLSTWIFLR